MVFFFCCCCCYFWSSHPAFVNMKLCSSKAICSPVFRMRRQVGPQSLSFVGRRRRRRRSLIRRGGKRREERGIERRRRSLTFGEERRDAAGGERRATAVVEGCCLGWPALMSVRVRTYVHTSITLFLKALSFFDNWWTGQKVVVL